MMEAPSDYRKGYDKARLVDKDAADNHIAHTLLVDPVMDAVVELASIPRSQFHQFLRTPILCPATLRQQCRKLRAMVKKPESTLG